MKTHFRSTVKFLSLSTVMTLMATTSILAADDSVKKKKKSKDSDTTQNAEVRPADRIVIPANSLDIKKSGYYLEEKEVLVINPDEAKEAKVSIASSLPTGKYNVTVMAIGEDDGESRYSIAINGDRLKEQKCPLAKKTVDRDPRYWLTWSKVEIESGDIIEVRSTVHTKKGDDHSRGRWSAIAFDPADEKTRLALQDNKKPETSEKSNMKAESTKTISPDVPSPSKPRAASTDRKPFPKHWGEPPAIQTRDLGPLPDGYGMGSSTLRSWIQSNLDRDALKTAAKNSSANAPTKPSEIIPSEPKAKVPTTPRKSVAQVPRQANGSGSVSITGELKQWYKATLTLDGPFAHEQDFEPNPFTDYRMSVTFKHESGSPIYEVPGYFAADGKASETSAEGGTQWRAHFAPDRIGRWMYTVHFSNGKNSAFDTNSSTAMKPYDGIEGRILVEPSTKTGRDFRAHGRLQYVGKRYLQFAGTQESFLKLGADSPETLLAYEDFDNTIAGKAPKVPLKSWKPHVDDWRSNDPTWKGGKGKGLIGAVNYLADQGVNAISFLTYNAGGDGDNVWPFVERDGKLNYDCSKLDQWGIVFDHATSRGIYLHFKLQENEIDDNRRGDRGDSNRVVPEALDGGLLGIERKLYCREMIARFGHALALNWNIGEENTQSSDEVRDMVKYIYDTDPYKHNIVLHTFPNQQDKVYLPLLGNGSLLTGLSLQNSWQAAHALTYKWIRESELAGRPWVVANDEQNSAATGVPADAGYEGSDGTAQMDGGKRYSLHDVRKATLWGNLMAGGGGVEYYFGYKLPQNDLLLEDFRSRHQSWNYGRIALEFFHKNKLPMAEMTSADGLIGGDDKSNDRYCLAKLGQVYVIYLANGGTTKIDLSGAPNTYFTVRWYNPRTGGELIEDKNILGGAERMLGEPPTDKTEDWVAIIRAHE